MINKLFEPISLGPIDLAILCRHDRDQPPIYTGGRGHRPSIEFYTARARGGVGLIVVGGAEINDQASGRDLMLSIKDDRYLPGLRRLANAIHREGAKTAIQLYMAVA